MFNHKHCVKAGLLASAIALTGCGSSSSDSKDDSPASGRSGTEFNGLSMSAKGGSSILGDGGNGGYVEIFKTNSTTDLSIVKTGNIDTSYTLPSQTPEFGVNPVTIATTQTIKFVEDPDNDPLPEANTLYMVPNLARLFKSSGDKTIGHESHEVTGLTIEEGATLFLPANSGTTAVNLFFNNDIQNDGIITTVNGEINTRVNLSLTAAAYYGAGNIDLKGDTANRYRQSGGQLNLTAYTINHSGLINTSGANKSSENNTGNGGANAGSINLTAEIYIETTGELRANGGHSDTDAGTNGADINLSAAAIVNTGLINSNSGSGNSQLYYSNSSDIRLYAIKSILNTGTISSIGADASDSGNAGKGGDINLAIVESNDIAFSQSIINTGDLIVDGGSITGDSTGRAGHGGNINIYNDEDTEEEYYAPTVFEISGNLSANGGSTIEENSDAGSGGNIFIANIDNPSSSAQTFLIGYDEINTSGGNGLSAGSAGDIDIDFEDIREDIRGGYYVPTVSGSIYNNAALIANGGNTTAEEQEPGLEAIYGGGADAGEITISASNYSAYLQPGAINVTNEGVISANGGNSFNSSSTSSANGGNVSVAASHAVTINQPISLNGGSDLHVADAAESNNHAGSYAGSVTIFSQYELANIDTDIEANGGTGDLDGGDAGSLNITSKAGIKLNGSVTLNGGNAIANDTDSLETQGGDAGYVYVVTETMDSMVNATITANAGAGDVMGEEKIVYVDADCLSNNCQR